MWRIHSFIPIDPTKYRIQLRIPTIGGFFFLGHQWMSPPILLLPFFIELFSPFMLFPFSYSSFPLYRIITKCGDLKTLGRTTCGAINRNCSHLMDLFHCFYRISQSCYPKAKWVFWTRMLHKYYFLEAVSHWAYNKRSTDRIEIHLLHLAHSLKLD